MIIDRGMCWDNVAECVIAMFGMGDIYAEPCGADRHNVSIHGYSFEPREHNRELFEEVVAFIVPRLPQCMGLEISIVCPNGLLEMEHNPLTGVEKK